MGIKLFARGPSWKAPVSAATLLLAFTATAHAQTSISVYGGYAGMNGADVSGHFVGLSNIHRFVRTPDGGFYGLRVHTDKIASPVFGSFSFYFDGFRGSETIENNGERVGMVFLALGASATLNPGYAFTKRQMQRHELGLRGDFLSGAPNFRFFVTPFVGLGRDGTHTEVVDSNLANTLKRRGKIDWWYAGADLGAEKEVNLGHGLSLVGNASAGVYWADTDGNFSSVGTGILPISDAMSDRRQRAGLRFRGGLDLKQDWSEAWTSSLFGQLTYWSDVPFAVMPTSVFAPRAQTSFDSLTEYRVGVRLTYTFR